MDWLLLKAAVGDCLLALLQRIFVRKGGISLWGIRMMGRLLGRGRILANLLIIAAVRSGRMSWCVTPDGPDFPIPTTETMLQPPEHITCRPVNARRPGDKRRLQAGLDALRDRFACYYKPMRARYWVMGGGTLRSRIRMRLTPPDNQRTFHLVVACRPYDLTVRFLPDRMEFELTDAPSVADESGAA